MRGPARYMAESAVLSDSGRGRHGASGRNGSPRGGIAMICKLTPEEEVRMHILLKGIADDPNALEMQKFIQHGSVTTYEHCMRVTRIAFWLNIHLRANADEASLVKGAFLHDFYLYDWHNCRNCPVNICTTRKMP